MCGNAGRGCDLRVFRLVSLAVEDRIHWWVVGVVRAGSSRAEATEGLAKTSEALLP